MIVPGACVQVDPRRNMDVTLWSASRHGEVKAFIRPGTVMLVIVTSLNSAPPWSTPRFFVAAGMHVGWISSFVLAVRS